MRKRPILAILLLTLLVRCGFLYKNWDNLDLASSFLLHAEVARNILNNHWFEKNQSYLNAYIRACYDQQKLLDPADFPPPQTEALAPLYNDEGGYGLLLAALWRLFGTHRWWYIRVLQILLDVLMCWLVYRIGRQAFHERAGIVAALLYALFLPAVELAVRPHRDIWVTFLYITATYLLVRNREVRTPLWQFAVLGAAAALVAWMRSTVVPFTLVLGVLFFTFKPPKEAVRCAAAMMISFLVLFSPLVIRNYVVFDKFMVTRGAFWHSFWAGVGQMPNPYGLHEDDEEIARFASKLDSSAKFETERYEQVLKEEAMEFLSSNPLWYAGSVLKRAGVIVFPKVGRALFFQETPTQHVSGTHNRLLSQWVLLGADVFLGGLFLWGLWRERNHWKKLLVTVTPYLYTLVTLAPFYVAGRNIANSYYVILLFSAYSLVLIWDKLKPRFFMKQPLVGV